MALFYWAVVGLAPSRQIVVPILCFLPASMVTGQLLANSFLPSRNNRWRRHGVVWKPKASTRFLLLELHRDGMALRLLSASLDMVSLFRLPLVAVSRTRLQVYQPQN